MKELVLVLNCGSSSIKFAVMHPETGDTAFSGLVECIAMVEAKITSKWNGSKEVDELPNLSYHDALVRVIDLLKKYELADKILAVGHRVVHGGENFTASALITEKALDEVRSVSNLAPLHNPANIMGIEIAQQIFPDLPQVAVFDTAFHQTMPQEAFLYAVPYELYEEQAVRRYGFHGTSHGYVTKKAAEMLGKPLNETKFISAHLGNGSSMAAVDGGKCMDTSMGLTPLEGLIMGTRSGDVDPSLHAFLADSLGYDVHKVTTLLNKQSGLKGISGISSDMRAIEDAAAEGNERAILAEDMFAYRVAKYVGAYMVPLGGLDALIFTAGIGENGPPIRAKIINRLKAFGFELDEERNNNRGRDSNGIITKEGTPIAMVVPTNEELVIAQDAARLAKG